MNGTVGVQDDTFYVLVDDHIQSFSLSNVLNVVTNWFIDYYWNLEHAVFFRESEYREFCREVGPLLLCMFI